MLRCTLFLKVVTQQWSQGGTKGAVRPSILQILTNYEHLALSKTMERVKGDQWHCGHCALCGSYGKHIKEMVLCVSQLMSKTKTFQLNQNFTCANYGIYVATCVLCHEQYIGQTKKKFSKICSSHRSNRNRTNCKDDKKDEVDFSRHYALFHGNVNKPPIHKAHTVTFIQQSNFHSLIGEDEWYNQFDAQIYIHSMILPAWHIFFPFCTERWCVLIIATSMLAFWFSTVTAFQMSTPFWLPFLNASLAYAFCSYAESYSVLFLAKLEAPPWQQLYCSENEVFYCVNHCSLRWVLLS